MSNEKHWFLKRWFLQGLVITLPISVTAILLYYLVTKTDLLLTYLWSLLPWTLPAWISPWVGLLLVAGLLIVIGALTESWLVNKCWGVFNKLVSMVPIIRTVYNTIYKVVESTIGNYNGLSKTVLIQFPRPGIYAIAFKTSNGSAMLNKATGRKVINVFLPTTPNPTSGFYLVIPEEEVIETEISPEDAFKLIISAGIVQDK